MVSFSFNNLNPNKIYETIGINEIYTTICFPIYLILINIDRK